MNGLISLPWWGYILTTLLLTHLTILTVTLFLHRCQAHHALALHPALAHIFRFWSWLTTGMVTREWVAIHRKHHAYVETPMDPHSPQILGIDKVLWQGAEIYRKEYLTHPETVEHFSHGTPNDWIERNLYSRESPLGQCGIVLMLLIDFALFGFAGVAMWAVQMAWIPFFAAGVINGVGHYWGYRNWASPDASTNIIPWGILIGGEELHNNHHAFASSAKFSTKSWEFDIGWLYIRILSALGLARVKKIAPRPAFDPEKHDVDLETVKAVIANRFHVLADYANRVVRQVYREEVRRSSDALRGEIVPLKSLLNRPEVMLDEASRQKLESGLAKSEALSTVYRFKADLQRIWSAKTASYDHLLELLVEWRKEAAASGVKALEDFARDLPSYTLKVAKR